MIAQLFTIFARSFWPEALPSFLMLTAALAVSFVAGFVTPFAPAGIGVREGMLTIHLSPFVPSPLGVFLALSSRIWFTLSEILVIGLVHVVSRIRVRGSRE